MWIGKLFAMAAECEVPAAELHPADMWATNLPECRWPGELMVGLCSQNRVLACTSMVAWMVPRRYIVPHCGDTLQIALGGEESAAVGSGGGGTFDGCCGVADRGDESGGGPSPRTHAATVRPPSTRRRVGEWGLRMWMG